MAKKYAIKVKGRGFYCGIKKVESRRWINYDDPKYAQHMEKPARLTFGRAITTSKGEHVWISTFKLIFKRNASDIPSDFKFESAKIANEKIAEIKLDTDLLKEKSSFWGNSVRKFVEVDIDDKGIELLKKSFTKLEAVVMGEVDFPKRVLKSKTNYYAQSALELHVHDGEKLKHCRKCGTNLLENEQFAELYNWDVCIHCLASFAKDIEMAYEKTPKENKEAYLNARMLSAI